MLEWKHFNAAEGNVMTTITNVAFTELSHKLCCKDEYASYIARHTQSHKQQPLFKVAFNSDIY